MTAHQPSPSTPSMSNFYQERSQPGCQDQNPDLTDPSQPRPLQPPSGPAGPQKRLPRQLVTATARVKGPWPAGLQVHLAGQEGPLKGQASLRQPAVVTIRKLGPRPGAHSLGQLLAQGGHKGHQLAGPTLKGHQPSLRDNQLDQGPINQVQVTHQGLPHLEGQTAMGHRGYQPGHQVGSCQTMVQVISEVPLGYSNQPLTLIRPGNPHPQHQ